MSLIAQPEPMTRTDAIRTARRMAEAGWSIKHIQRYLAARGQRAAWDTVRGWVDPDYAEKRRARLRTTQRNWWRERHNAQPRPVSPTAAEKFVRLLELRRAGLSTTATAAVLRLDCGDDITGNQVRWAEGVGHYPRRLGGRA